MFWYGAPSVTKSNQWQISFQTTYTSGGETFVDNLSNQITISLNNVAPTIGGFTPAVGPDAGAQQACGKIGGSSGYDPTTVNYGQFTNVVNGSADVTNNTEELCYSLAIISAPVGSTATYAIDQSGNVTKTGGTAVNGTYEFQCTVTDASPSCVTSVGSLPFQCNYEVVLGTPAVYQALCFGVTSSMGTLDTTCNWNESGTGYPIEVFFGLNTSTSSTTNGTYSFINTNIDPSITSSRKYLINSDSDTKLRYYNVRQEANTTVDLKFQCIPSRTFSTGALTRGVVAIKVTLSKTAFVSTENEYETDFTILYRSSALDPWQLATYDQVNGGGSSSVIGNLNNLSVSGTGASSTSFIYEFSNTGEYAVRNNGVRSTGCTSCTTCAEFKVDFYDATTYVYPAEGPPAVPCTGCDGPL